MTAPLLTYEQVTTLLAVSERTVRALVASGELEAVRIGRAVRFEQAAVDRFVRRQATRTTRKARAQRVRRTHPVWDRPDPLA